MGTETRDKPWLTPELRKAIEELERLEGDRQMRELVEARRRQVQLQATLLRGSSEEGREATEREIARRLLAEGLPPERVASLTGLELDVLRSL
jgi:predicted transposase/invertase (TIGR01784 family)